MKRLLGVLALPLCLLSGSFALAGDDVPTKADIERDLVLEVTRTSARVIQPGEPVRLKTRLVNHSKTRAYKVVEPGDGSESGWREPYVFLEAAAVGADGQHVAVPARPIRRCGNYDANWHDEVVTVEPGASLVLYNWMPSAHGVFDFQAEGHYELTLHYRYSRGTLTKGGGREARPDVRGPMGDVPAFELTSPPVDVHVVRHADVRLEVVGTLQVGQAARLSDVSRLQVQNRGDGPLAVSGAEITLRVLPPPGEQPLVGSVEKIAPTLERRTPPLGAGRTRTWHGSKARKELPDWRLVPLRPGTIRVEAVWRPTGGRALSRSAPARIEIRGP